MKVLRPECRCFPGAVSGNRNVCPALKDYEGNVLHGTFLNLGGNTKAFVPFGGESLFCIQRPVLQAVKQTLKTKKGGRTYAADGLSKKQYAPNAEIIFMMKFATDL